LFCGLTLRYRKTIHYKAAAACGVMHQQEQAMGFKTVICHISCMLIAVALYGISGISNHFRMNLDAGPFVLLAIGLIGFSYCSYISQEKAAFTAIKLLALSFQWFCFLFGFALAIYSVSNSPWYLYLGGAIACGCVFIALLKVQKIGG
jgi:hypothetical protein